MNSDLPVGFGTYALQKIDEGDDYAPRGLLLHRLKSTAEY